MWQVNLCYLNDLHDFYDLHNLHNLYHMHNLCDLHIICDMHSMFVFRLWASKNVKLQLSHHIALLGGSLAASPSASTCLGRWWPARGQMRGTGAPGSDRGLNSPLWRISTNSMWCWVRREGLGGRSYSGFIRISWLAHTLLYWSNRWGIRRALEVGWWKCLDLGRRREPWEQRTKLPRNEGDRK